MQLRANLKLRLNKESFPLTVRSRTFEKASFDEYLAASIALRTIRDRDANDYIDDITGEGSLNPYLKKMVEKARALPKETLKRIMKDSLFPVEKIDQSQSVVYYPDFSISIFAGKAYPGDLTKDSEKLKGLVHYEGELAAVEVDPSILTSSDDNFRVSFDDEDATIEIASGVMAKTSLNSISAMLVDPQEPSTTPGWYAHLHIEGEDWNGLTASVLDTIKAYSGFFADGNYYLLAESGLRRMTLGKFATFYLYKDERIAFDAAGKELCDRAVDRLLESPAFNEYKTKSFIALLTFCSPKKTVDAANTVLAVKESPELAQFSLRTLEGGVKLGWEKPALIQMKRNATKGDLQALYPLDPSLFSLEDLLGLPKAILTAQDAEKVEAYERDRQAKIDTIKSIRGDLASSSLREDSKLLLSDPEVKEFRKLVNDDVAHNKNDIAMASDAQLDALLSRALRLQDLMKIVAIKIARVKR